MAISHATTTKGIRIGVCVTIARDAPVDLVLLELEFVGQPLIGVPAHLLGLSRIRRCPQQARVHSFPHRSFDSRGRDHDLGNRVPKAHGLLVHLRTTGNWETVREPSTLGLIGLGILGLGAMTRGVGIADNEASGSWATAMSAKEANRRSLG